MVKLLGITSHKGKEPEFGIIMSDKYGNCGKYTTYARIKEILKNPITPKNKIISNVIPIEYVKGIDAISEEEVKNIAGNLYDESEKEKMENDIKVIISLFKPNFENEALKDALKDVDRAKRYYKFVSFKKLRVEEFNNIIRFLEVENLASEKAYKLYIEVMKYIFTPEKWEDAFRKKGVLISPKYIIL
jgi:hypothetical protein